MDILRVRTLAADELERRRLAPSPISYAQIPGGPEELYGLTGAIHCRAVLGLSLGDRAQREAWAARLLAWRDESGWFRHGEGPGHALHQVISALNVLGEPIPRDLAPLAPRETAALPDWLAAHDWRSTHKELCCRVAPVLASQVVDEPWRRAFAEQVTARLDPARPRATWCAEDDPPWRVISCVYHVLSAFDAGSIAYPQPAFLLQRLLDLNWDTVSDAERRTECTDGDWAWLLLRLMAQLPAQAPTVMAAIQRVAVRRRALWQPEQLSALSTHHLYCRLWVEAVFQHAWRDGYHGGWLRDTQNDATLSYLG